MLVVADSTPINVLVRAGLVDLLPQLFGKVAIPVAVAKELQHPRTPQVIRDFMARPPEWLSIHTQVESELIPPLDLGESAAIHLALALRADFLLLDERDGRRIAIGKGISVIGTIGLLDRAALGHKVDFEKAIAALPAEFIGRIDPAIIESIRHRIRSQ